MGVKMILREFTSEANEDGSKIVRVRARVSDHAERGAQSEWIEFQFKVDLATRLNGARLRQNTLEKARDTLMALAKEFGRIADEAL